MTNNRTVTDLANDVDNTALVVVGLMQKMTKRLVDPQTDANDALRINYAVDALDEAFEALGHARTHLLGEDNP